MFRFGDGVTNGYHNDNSHRCDRGRGYRSKCRDYYRGCLREETPQVCALGCFVWN